MCICLDAKSNILFKVANHEHRGSWSKRDGDHEQMARAECKIDGGSQSLMVQGQLNAEAR